MSDHHFLHWDRDSVRVRAWSTANKGKATTLKIELEVSDPHRLEMLIYELQEAQKKRARPAPATTRKIGRAPERLALPAPQLRLEDRSR